MITEAQVDCFNLPIYAPSPKQMTQLIEENDQFIIETLELLDPPGDNHRRELSEEDMVMWTNHVRAAMDGMFLKCFEIEVVDEMFERLVIRLCEDIDRINSGYREKMFMFLVLKRK